MKSNEHALATIARTGSTPMKAQPLAVNTLDDRMVGNTLANEAIALAKTGVKPWLALAWRVIDCTVEARAVFIGAIKNEKAALTKAQTEHEFDGKYAKGNTNSFSVMLSRLQGVANAFNGGATLAGLVEYTNKQQANKAKHLVDVEDARANLGFEAIHAYAMTFVKSKAGRTPDAWLVTFGKFLERNKPVEGDAVAEAQYLATVKHYNSMTKG
jgi:hypothetical protein